MRLFLAIVLFALAPGFIAAQNEKQGEDQDHEEFNKNYLQFFKKVKSVKIFEKSNLNFPNRDFDQIDYKIVESKNIDHMGRLSSIMYFSYNPDTQHRFFFEYDSSSLTSCKKINLKNETVFQWNFNQDTLVAEEIRFSNGKRKFLWKYKYDEGMNLVDVSKIKRSGKVAQQVLRGYDSLNRMVSYRVLNGSGKVKYTGLLTYRDTSEYLLSSVFMKRGKIVEKTLYTYDSAGQLTEKLDYGKKGFFESKTKFEYDSLSRKIKTSVLDRNMVPNFIAEFQYDGGDRVIKETIKNRIGLIMRKTEYEYDGFDNVKFQRIFNNYLTGTNELLIYNDYDSNGNLLEERIESLDTNHKLVRKHEYQYYNDEEIVLE